MCITKLLLPKLECKLQMLPHPKQTRKRHFECYTKKHRLVKAQYFILWLSWTALLRIIVWICKHYFKYCSHHLPGLPLQGLPLQGYRRRRIDRGGIGGERKARGAAASRPHSSLGRHGYRVYRVIQKLQLVLPGDAGLRIFTLHCVASAEPSQGPSKNPSKFHIDVVSNFPIKMEFKMTSKC